MFLLPPHHPPSTSGIRSDLTGTLFYVAAVLIMLVISYLALAHPSGLPVFGPTQERL